MHDSQFGTVPTSQLVQRQTLPSSGKLDYTTDSSVKQQYTYLSPKAQMLPSRVKLQQHAHTVITNLTPPIKKHRQVNIRGEHADATKLS